MSVDGVCLTVEALSETEMGFALGPETLKITGWSAELIKNKRFNLERALSFHQALGGHLVTGHVDGVAKVTHYQKEGGSVLLSVEAPRGFESFFWKKGFIALNGVSLTINGACRRILDFCLIPKTLEKTNLRFLKEGDLMNFETDYLTRPLVHGLDSLLRAVHSASAEAVKKQGAKK